MIKKFQKNIIFTKKFENIENINWDNLEKYFHTLMYYNELIENLQTLKTITPKLLMFVLQHCYNKKPLLSGFLLVLI